MPLPTADRLTDKVFKMLDHAQDLARAYKHEQVGVEHLLLALIQEESIATDILQDRNVDIRRVRLEVEKRIRVGQAELPDGRLTLALSSRLALMRADEEAIRLHHSHACTFHVLLAFLRDETNVAGEVLLRCGIGNIDDVREDVKNIYSKHPPQFTA